MSTFIPYAKQHISQADIRAVTKALSSNMVTRGPEVTHFEEEVAKFCGAKFAVALNSGTEAIAAAMFAAEASPHDHVVTSANTFIASATAAMRWGCRVHPVDLDLSTGNLSLENLERHLERPLSRGKIILEPVHYGGIPCDMRALDQMIRREDVVVIEDACAALGATYPSGEKVGSCAYSHMTVFSFHPAKSITTGEGGMVLTNSLELAERLRRYRNNGIVREEDKLQHAKPGPWYFESQELGINGNFTDFQAALGRSQLKRLRKGLEKKCKLVKKYREELSDCSLISFAPEETDSLSAHNLLAVRIDFDSCAIDKPALIRQLHEKGIGTQVHYIPIHHHPIFEKHFGNFRESLPQAETFYERTLSLPLFLDLTETQVKTVVKALKESLAKS